MYGNLSKPKVAWQIDSFGHSKEISSLMALLGLNAIFLARIDSDDRDHRRDKKRMEFIWQGNTNIGEKYKWDTSIFVNVMNDHYSSPKGFDFETQPPEKLIDLDDFASQIRQQAAHYKTKEIFVPMGDDFRYYRARLYFQKIDSLISLAESSPQYKLRLKYSTPSLYLKALYESNETWPTKEDDFFPYSNNKHAYWTGFYTSRPTLKYFERVGNNFLQICKQLMSMTGMSYSYELNVLREAMGVLQHHDAITGTAQQHVTDHYSKLLHQGIQKCSKPVDKALKKLMENKRNDWSPNHESCLKLNISECRISESSKKLIVTLYNPLSYFIDEYVRFPVTGNSYAVYDPKGEIVATQLLAIPETVQKIPGRRSLAKNELLFHAKDIPPLGLKSYYVSSEASPNEVPTSKGRKPELRFKNGILSEVHMNGKNLTIAQSIRYYKGSHHWTGAYIFRPVDELTHEPDENQPVRLHQINDGVFVTEYEQIFSDWVSQIIRVYKDREFVEFEWLVGPIPVSDYIGKEVISLFATNIKNKEAFYTDRNGRGMEKRIRNYRNWNKPVSEPIAGNYYPVTSRISINDSSSQLFVMNDRPQGGGSIRDGDVELMIHRRLCYDDGKGVDEPLNETAYGDGLVVRGKHWLISGKASDLTLGLKVKLFAQGRHSYPWLFFSDGSQVSFEDWKLNHINEFSGLVSGTVPQIRILTLEPWINQTLLLRLEHIFGKLSYSSVSETEVVDLKTLFSSFNILDVKETSLGGDRLLSDVKRIPWRTETGELLFEKVEAKELKNLTITLSPMEIRTLIITTGRPKL